MAHREKVQALLSDYGQVLGLQGVGLDEAGHCRLEFDQRVHLDLTFNEEYAALVAMSPLGEVPTPRPEGLMAELLNANVLWRGTSGGTLGLDQATGLVTLMEARVVESLDLQRLETWLDTFVSTASYWLDQVAAGPIAIEADTSGDRVGSGLLRA